MSKAPIGAVVSIGYTADPGVDAGDVLRTPTGRLYLRRYAIRAIVIEAAEPGWYQTHELLWNPRKPSAGKPRDRQR